MISCRGAKYPKRFMEQFWLPYSKNWATLGSLAATFELLCRDLAHF